MTQPDADIQERFAHARQQRQKVKFAACYKNRHPSENGWSSSEGDASGLHASSLIGGGGSGEAGAEC